MGYTPLPDHIFHQSPVKQVIATVLIAIFLGIGGAYVINRTSPVTKHVPAVVTTIAPSSIPTALPTEEIVPTTEPTSQEVQSCPIGSVRICEGGICQCDSSVQTTIAPTSSNQQSSSCPLGTVKVCQAGECECLPQ